VKGSKSSGGGAAAPAKKAAPVQAKAKAAVYAEKPDLDALSAGLPAGWKALWDSGSKELYYGCPSTKVGPLTPRGAPPVNPCCWCWWWPPLARRLHGGALAPCCPVPAHARTPNRNAGVDLHCGRKLVVEHACG
jgi:hypothetical protein